MNSAHDLGGMDGLGPIVAELDEPNFHEQWERHIFVVLLNVMCQGIANVDENRHAMESMGSIQYLASSYYEHWLAGMESQLIKKGHITEEEFNARVASFLANPESFTRPPVDPDDEMAKGLKEILDSGGPTLRDPVNTGRFAVGDEVRTINIHPRQHTRLPRYTRGKRGKIVACHGAHVYPDSHAALEGEDPKPLYTVEFTGAELWGEERGHRKDAVRIDLWEPYLTPVGEEN